MSTERMKGDWNKMKGDIKKQWGKLTDDDLMQIEGDQDKLLGKLQKIYGYNKQQAELELRKFNESHTRH